MAVNLIADTLAAGESTVFTGDDDPQLVAEALPFALKLYESLVEKAPDNPGLLLATGSAFTMYANAFLQTEADMLPPDQYEQRQVMYRRAKGLYLRGRGYTLRGLEARQHGITRLIQDGKLQEALKPVSRQEVAYLYWAAASWLAAYSTDTFDLELMLSLPKALALMNRALELDESFAAGSIHEFFVSYYGSMPASMGGSDEKARYHFQKTLEFSAGLRASPYVALATSVSVRNQNVREYRGLLEKALAVDPSKSPQNKLANILSQKKARWLLAHLEDFFLLEEGQSEAQEAAEGGKAP